MSWPVSVRIVARQFEVCGFAFSTSIVICAEPQVGCFAYREDIDSIVRRNLRNAYLNYYDES